MSDTKLCFQILGIQPTSDKKQIKKAYAQKASQCHPEENENEWMLLHEAYQKAGPVKKQELQKFFVSQSYLNCRDDETVFPKLMHFLKKQGFFRSHTLFIEGQLEDMIYYLNAVGKYKMAGDASRLLQKQKKLYKSRQANRQGVRNVLISCLLMFLILAAGAAIKTGINAYEQSRLPKTPDDYDLYQDTLPENLWVNLEVSSIQELGQAYLLVDERVGDMRVKRTTGPYLFYLVNEGTEAEGILSIEAESQEIFESLFEQAGPGLLFFGQTASIEADELSISEISELPKSSVISLEEIQDYPSHIEALLELGHMLYNRTVLQVDLDDTLDMWQQLETQTDSETHTDS